MRGLLLATAIAFTAVAGCVCGPSGVDGMRFACSAPEDCSPGFSCVDGECLDSTKVGLGDGGGDCEDAACTDAGGEEDAGERDAGEDAGVDAGELDAGSTDAGTEDAGNDDAGTDEDAGTCSGPEICDDGEDNDCDGFTDCADGDCAMSTCGAHGRVCGGAMCVCSGNGGAPQLPEQSCADGVDNDCNGLVDCADPACAGVACGSAGRVCTGAGCVCSGNGGAAQPVELSCTDRADNDCDGLIDCADPDCEGSLCDPLGKTCQQASCLCPADAGTAFPPEAACGDLSDNDCDGLVDCADTDCAGASCGAGGRVCQGAVCTCRADGLPSTSNETACTDGVDDDCDGAVDCADPDCAGTACGAFGTVCAGTTCTCSGNGGTPQLFEQTCNDGTDNDCDGLSDCADSDCAQRACGPSKTCEGNVCVCLAGSAAYEPVEQTCFDGIDNDCDGLVDCADPSCGQRTCAAGSSTMVCCGTTCADLTTSTSNCGGCGLRCKSGQACQTVTVGTITTGWCGCSNSNHCPGGQSCSSGHCACSSNSGCAAGQTCTGSPGVCHY